MLHAISAEREIDLLDFPNSFFLSKSYQGIDVVHRIYVASCSNIMPKGVQGIAGFTEHRAESKGHMMAFHITTTSKRHRFLKRKCPRIRQDARTCCLRRCTGTLPLEATV